MEQAITDYVKFLADARDAVYRLNNDQATAKQLKEQGERQEKELTAAKKAVTDSVNQTIKNGAVRSIQVMIKRSQKVRNG